MSDVTTTLRTQEISERMQAKQAQAHAGAATQTPQAAFPGDQVDLSAEAQQLIAGNATQTDDATTRSQQSVLSSANAALSEVSMRLNRLMAVYGVNSSQTNVAGGKVIEAIRNEVQRVAATVEPPTIDAQVRQELNLIIRQIAVQMSLPDDPAEPPEVSVDIGSAEFAYAPADEPTGSLLVAPGTQGTDESGAPADLSQAGRGTYFTTGDAASASALDRFAARPAQTDAQTAARPDLNQDGARNEADNGAVLLVRDSPRQERQAEAGLAQFVADLAVPIATRGSEAVPNRPAPRRAESI
ncbi:hypothetical protein [Oleispirillum naphthae]|uniref:hypothetical protein n=1 Tax=Oleispirillum naphthae TaxID=2838853 RepID=UPI0030826A24